MQRDITNFDPFDQPTTPRMTELRVAGNAIPDWFHQWCVCPYPLSFPRTATCIPDRLPAHPAPRRCRSAHVAYYYITPCSHSHSVLQARRRMGTSSYDAERRRFPP